MTTAPIQLNFEFGVRRVVPIRLNASYDTLSGVLILTDDEGNLLTTDDDHIITTDTE